METTNCCPPFDPAPWDGKTLAWLEKKFVTGSVFTVFYMPLNFGSVMSRMMKAVQAAGADAQGEPCLCEHASKWRMKLYIPVTKDVPGLPGTALSGTFLCKAYEGDYKRMAEWIRDFDAFARERQARISERYFWYTTCPKCAKAYGKNYTVIFGKCL